MMKFYQFENEGLRNNKGFWFSLLNVQCLDNPRDLRFIGEINGAVTQYLSIRLKECTDKSKCFTPAQR
jgi:hypothetical protein